MNIGYTSLFLDFLRNNSQRFFSFFSLCVCLVVQSCLTLCNPMDCSPHRLLCPWEFSRQEYWSGSPCPSPGDLPDPGIEPRSPALQADSLPATLPGSFLSINWIISRHLFSSLKILSCAWLSLLLNFNIDCILNFIYLFFSYRISVQLLL